VLAADGGDADVGGFAGFAKGVVAAIEVFAFLIGGKGLVSVLKVVGLEGRRGMVRVEDWG
jgi:hypothetical protein